MLLGVLAQDASKKQKKPKIPFFITTSELKKDITPQEGAITRGL